MLKVCLLRFNLASLLILGIVPLTRGSAFLHGALAAAPNMFAMSTCVPLKAVVSVRGMVLNFCRGLYANAHITRL